jgi:hypothetical protein
MIIVGAVLILMAIGFFFFMQTVASASTDPVDLMKTVGRVAGIAFGVSFVMIVVGLVGKKAQP